MSPSNLGESAAEARAAAPLTPRAAALKRSKCKKADPTLKAPAAAAATMLSCPYYPCYAETETATLKAAAAAAATLSGPCHAETATLEAATPSPSVSKQLPQQQQQQ